MRGVGQTQGKSLKSHETGVTMNDQVTLILTIQLCGIAGVLWLAWCVHQKTKIVDERIKRKRLKSRYVLRRGLERKQTRN
jgi:hypothetical protein